jgi:hypothetical protein
VKPCWHFLKHHFPQGLSLRNGRQLLSEKPLYISLLLNNRLTYLADSLLVELYPSRAWLSLTAAKQNHAFAQRDIGYLYKNGLGVEQDHQKAYGWYL